ncbi:nuclear transport factor 2 family protein [Salinicola endophyticus]|uniref:Nuclear transport factor 2 family protein n=1 Tax=Salinicola endophyticus TaxID=1949083 RepID=A0AB74U339_9GAMM
MEIERDAFREIESLEMELVDPSTQKNAARLQELLSDDFLEFGSSGMVIRKRDVVDSTNTSSTATYQLSDFEFKPLGGEHVLVTYRSVKSARELAYRSSIWAKRNGRWQILHHQSTIVPGSI